MPVNQLPVDPFLPDIRRAAAGASAMIITAAPGAGKTTRIPGEILDICSGGVILLEPRRVAVRMAAHRIAALRGGTPGGEVGYRIRGESRISAATRLTVMTPGVLLRMLHDDPSLEGISAVIFDEFHERGIDSDLAFALILDLAALLRPDLKVCIMSATLDVKALKDRLGAETPVFDLPGKLFPVEIRWSSKNTLIPDIAADAAKAVLEFCREDIAGDMLVFLPGVPEITKVQQLLAPAVPEDRRIMPLYGTLSIAEQSRVLETAPPGIRKIILSTNIAESSLTIEGVTMVIDSGWERRMRYSPAAGFSSLETLRIPKSSAAQRAGRAGRTAPGVVKRLWDETGHAARADYQIPEICECDLAPSAAAVAAWGTPVADLPWLDPPPSAQWQEAVTLLQRLGAVDSSGRITDRGRQISALPVHPRLGAMLLHAAGNRMLPTALDVAALLEERDDFRYFNSADLRLRLRLFHRDPGRFSRQRQIRDQLAALFPPEQLKGRSDPEQAGILIAAAFPGRVGRRRGTHDPLYRLAGCGAAALRDDDDLVTEEFLAVAALENSAFSANNHIRLAAPISAEDVEKLFGHRIVSRTRVDFSPESGRATARRERLLEGIVLNSSPAAVPPEELAQAVLDAALNRNIAMPPAGAAAALLLKKRIIFAAAVAPERFPDWSQAEIWRQFLQENIVPCGIRNFNDLEKLPWHDLLRNALGREVLMELDRCAPALFRTPGGRELKIDYAGDIPTAAVRIQDLYGLDKHPCAAGRALKLELLSPAMRPVQITTDLPGFWRGSWTLVRKEMRSRYPKHDWPEHPESAAAPGRKK